MLLAALICRVDGIERVRAGARVGDAEIVDVRPRQGRLAVSAIGTVDTVRAGGPRCGGGWARRTGSADTRPGHGLRVTVRVQERPSPIRVALHRLDTDTVRTGRPRGTGGTGRAWCAGWSGEWCDVFRFRLVRFRTRRRELLVDSRVLSEQRVVRLRIVRAGGLDDGLQVRDPLRLDHMQSHISCEAGDEEHHEGDDQTESTAGTPRGFRQCVTTRWDAASIAKTMSATTPPPTIVKPPMTKP